MHSQTRSLSQLINMGALMQAVFKLMTILALVACPRTASAWSAAGHKIIASICYRELPPTQREVIVGLMKAHPRFVEDFAGKMPDDIQNGGEGVQAEWLFQQASIWPDLVRSGPAERRAYDRPQWHFVYIPHFLTRDDYKAMHDSVKVNLESKPPANNFDDKQMNIVQAINNSVRIVRDPKQPAALRSVHICWLFHLVGDIHQPLYTTELFSRQLFPQGDRGGNAIKTNPLGNLHRAWDLAFGSDSFKDTRNTAVKLRNEEHFARIQSFARQEEESSAEHWSRDGHSIAKLVVYDREVSGQLESLERNGGDIDAEPIQLSEHYLRQRRMVADEWAALAGIRLAAVLSEVL